MKSIQNRAANERIEDKLHVSSGGLTVDTTDELKSSAPDTNSPMLSDITVASNLTGVRSQQGWHA